MCPANWKEGKATMKPDPKGSLAYFESVNTNGEHADADGPAKKRSRH